jgi:hypothetical protein
MSWVPEILRAVVHESATTPNPAADHLLKWEWWGSKQNIPRHGLPHARFMEPYCRVFPTESMKPFFKDLDVDEVTSQLNDIQLVLYVSFTNSTLLL